MTLNNVSGFVTCHNTLLIRSKTSCCCCYFYCYSCFKKLLLVLILLLALLTTQIFSTGILSAQASRGVPFENTTSTNHVGRPGPLGGQTGFRLERYELPTTSKHGDNEPRTQKKKGEHKQHCDLLLRSQELPFLRVNSTSKFFGGN